MSPIDDLRRPARELLGLHWREEGYTMPNRATYPWQWLWDSCFHAIAWGALGDDRGLTELEMLFAFQGESGFVPHMGYHGDPDAAVPVWGQAGASTITQPPMYGHAIARLAAMGIAVPDELIERAVKGLQFLLRSRQRTSGGLIEVVHPWETGCDDSARWDDAIGSRYDLTAWRQHKLDLLPHVEVDSGGGALRNDRFRVGSVGFNALIAFNALELDSVISAPELANAATELSEILTSCWDDERRTWTDQGTFHDGSGQRRTTDAHFALLVDDDGSHLSAAAADLCDPAAFGAPFGPRGAHRDAPTYDPDIYWRGPAWPQMSYLLWWGLQVRGEVDAAADVRASTVAGVRQSGFGEYWNPESGEGRGAIPQSWATIVVAMDSPNDQ